jgi:hypothetical protein
LDNTVKSNKIEDVVFWYKAKIRDNFRVGHPSIWNMHRQKYDPNYDDHNNTIVPEATAIDSRKPSIKISKLKF